MPRISRVKPAAHESTVQHLLQYSQDEFVVVDHASGHYKFNPTANIEYDFWLYPHSILLHREGAPALTHRNLKTGQIEIEHWCKKGLLHRTDGPACYNHTTKTGSWNVNGLYHRTDGPAVVNIDGECYYKHGHRHRVDGPAVESRTGIKEWWVNGYRHRIGGPAVMAIGEERWYENGVLHRLDGPAVIRKECELWYKNGRPHRTDGPALITKYHSNVEQEWYINGKRHRTDGPAVITVCGTFAYYFRGKKMTQKKWEQAVESMTLPQMTHSQLVKLVGSDFVYVPD